MTSDARIGIVGPGLMGLGLCHAAAVAGLHAVLVGRDGTAAVRGHERLAADLGKRVARGKMAAAECDRLLGAVSAALDDGELAGCGLVIEAVAEQRTVKAAVLRRIESVAAPGAIIASNTSGLAIGGMAASLADPKRFIGLHFFSPVDRMALVEVVVGPETSPDTTASALVWVHRLGKQPIVVRDSPGFFTSRIFTAYLDEAVAMLAEGVEPESIEAAARAACLAIGPLAVLDETGLALNWQQARQARADRLDDLSCRVLAWPVLDRLVGLGRRGRRDGGGFYDHPAGAARRLWDGLAELYPPRGVSPPLVDIERRLLNAQALEAARCLERGIVASAADANTGSILGLGFPAARGGVLADVERRGIAAFVAECDALADRHGERFRPSSWLRERAARSTRFDA
jgi:3-hydroxyacyl-CoA dehydrogenase/enoyl-CoA hydratase/3-hydroxybutyryl-CoA epimerase